MPSSAVFVSLGACALAAVLEAICAGNQVKRFFATLRFPRYSAPLWVWSLVGGMYYLIFGFVIYRLLRLDRTSGAQDATLLLIGVMMVLNGLTNLLIFRARKSRLSFLVGTFFPVMDLTLLVFLSRLDRLAAWSLAPYLLYRIYGMWWGYAVWRLNATP